MQMTMMAHQKTLLKEKEKEHQVRQMEVRLGKRSLKALPDSY